VECMFRQVGRAWVEDAQHQLADLAASEERVQATAFACEH
jgi:hypothetical protein